MRSIPANLHTSSLTNVYECSPITISIPPAHSLVSHTLMTAQQPQRNPILLLPQPRLPLPIIPLKNLHILQLRTDTLHLLHAVQIHSPLLNKLHQRNPCHHLRHGGNSEDGIIGDGFSASDLPDPRHR